MVSGLAGWQIAKAVGLFGASILAAIFVTFIHLLGLAPPMETLLAFAPGGQAEMTILVLIAGVDIAFVIAHHVLRIVIVGAPIAARLFSQQPKRWFSGWVSRVDASR